MASGAGTELWQFLEMAGASSMRWQGTGPGLEQVLGRAGVCALQRRSTYTLKWLQAALAGPDAAAIEAACVPETEAELERHRDFVRRRGGVEAQVPDAKLVLWSKSLAVVEQPNGLDSFHHGTSAELWALAQHFDPDANYCARTQTRATDEECRAAVARLRRRQ